MLTFAFVDLAGYTALTEAHGDQQAADIVARFYRLVERELRTSVRIIKRLGDGVMLVGDDAIAAAATVVAVTDAIDAEDDFPGVRAGLASGGAIERDGDYFGATVNLCARIAAHARAGEILCDERSAVALEASTWVHVLPMGSVAFKNIVEPMRVFSFARARGPVGIAVDPVCRMRIAHGKATTTHRGVAYSFCSPKCADRFRSMPDAFVSTARS